MHHVSGINDKKNVQAPFSMLHSQRLVTHQKLSRIRCPLRYESSTERSVTSSATDMESGEKPSETTKNYFTLLGIVPRFAVDDKELKSAYKTLMAGVHPDRFATKSEEERELKHTEASDITRAYGVIRDPLDRAVHLLELAGIPFDETSSGDLVGMEFLMQIMEIREDVEAASSDEDLQKLLDANKNRIVTTIGELQKSFEEPNFEEAVRQTACLRYWNRAEETVREKMSEIN